MKIWFTSVFISIIVSAYGQSIAGFELQDEVAMSSFKLESMRSKKAVVVIFFSNQCAYARHYTGRIKTMQQRFSNKDVEFVLINSNDATYSPEESPDSMRLFALNNGLELPYLSDKQKIVKTLFGAKRTPEVFVLKPSNNQFNIVYQGAIDDNPQVESDVDHHYLNDAVVSLLAGKEVETKSSRTAGCLIK